MSTVLFSHVSFSYGATPVLGNVSFACGPGDCLAVVGPNGVGKSTLLALAAGLLEPDSGTVSAPPVPPAAAFLTALPPAAAPPPTTAPSPTTAPPSAAPPPPSPTGSTPLPPSAEAHGARTVARFIEAATSGTRALAARFDALTERLAQGASPRDEAEYDRILAAMTARDAWTIDARLDQTLEALGLGGVDRSRALASLSPGQRARLRLALVLVERPDALVLDEPTNHLDADGREHLARAIDDWQGPVLMTSHDRAFIERTATALLDLDPAPWRALAVVDGEPADFGAYRVGGSYSDYLRDKAAARSRHTAVHAEQQAVKRRLAAHRRDSAVVGHARFKPRTETRMAQKYYADRAQAVSTRRINDDSRRLAALAAREVPKPRYDEAVFVFPRPSGSTAGGPPPLPRSGGIALSVRGASVEGRLAPTSFEVRHGEHLLITGPNGSGKTTLLEWIARGAPAGAHGRVDAAPGAVLVPQEPPRPGDPLVPEDAWRLGVGEAGRGFVPPALWNRPLGGLSAGNQRRAQLAWAARAAPRVLVIDEPTNYLDLDALESLEESLRQWGGTLVASTHDEWLIAKWWGNILRLEGAHGR
ncbi:ATP-binding cassette domain-containing protein [Schaalia sp. HMT-877]|nr:ABC transporter, ATP-binding protein [Actinomyces sp. oral taxon 877 str. F0543]WLD80376.1 ATP-binding cassette domain-containing protein [Schaalia sp. HMT-877]